VFVNPFARVQVAGVSGRQRMPDRTLDPERYCHHCGALDAPKLGRCVVCYLPVCDKCGNVQHVHGERRVIHDACLADDEKSFSMIKFVH
jgi:hypothetical protein